MSRRAFFTYIGSFPPPYGGVTVKNALLYKHLSARLDMDQVDLSKIRERNIHVIMRFAVSIVSRRGSLVLGTSAIWRRRVTNYLWLFNRRKMSRSSLFIMGGKVPIDRSYIARLGCYRHVYVETESMRRSFEELGATNVSVYPNCRERPASLVTSKPSGGSLRAVYLSLICPEKGSDLVLDAARMLPEVQFHFYGRIPSDYERHFRLTCDELSNVFYHGIFDSVKDDIVLELCGYDVHLFPTLCPNEGVPGVIVETKMASVPTVASMSGYNSELIRDGVDGVLVGRDSASELVSALSELNTDRARLHRMKLAALSSAETFCIDRYVNWLVSGLEVGHIWT